MWHRILDCLGIAVGITSRPPELAPLLDAVFRGYADAAGPVEVDYLLEVAGWPRLVRDGTLVRRHDEVGDLVPALEIDLYAQVMARADGVLVHAAAVVGLGGAALVLAGRSGAGKSTLTRALLARGFAYLTEECVALHPAGTCTGLPRPMHVDDPAVRLPPGFACDDYVLRRTAAGGPGRLFHPPETAIWRAPASVAAIVGIDHAPDATATLAAQSTGAALAELWPLVFRPDRAAVEDAAIILGRTPRYRLRTSRAEDAVAHVLRLAEELGVVQR